MNRLSDSSETVAAFCATTAGWYRISGHVTKLSSSTRSVT